MSKSFFDNTIIKRLRSKEKVTAGWASLASNISTEILAECGLDIIVIDMEHSHLSLPMLISMIQAMKGTNAIPIVRAPWNDLVWCKQILDAGAYGIHVPYVSTKNEAIAAVKACKYAPMGYRGLATSHRGVNYGLCKEEYFARANSDILVIVAIETPEGVENINEIISVEGVDGIFIGPSDLATSMGHLANPSDPEVQAAIRKVEEAVFASDKFLGTIAPNMEAAAALYKRGYTVVYSLSDLNCIVRTVKSELEYFNQHIRK